MKLDNVWVSQTGLRSTEVLLQMYKDVVSGKIFSLENIASYTMFKTDKSRPDGLVEIAEFPDGQLMIHNGHHRATAIYLGRTSKEIYSSEYSIRKWTYEDYDTLANLPVWTTPFNPKTEYRVANLKYWKHFILEYYKNGGEAYTKLYINKVRSSYCQLRNGIYTLEDFINANRYNYLLRQFGATSS